MDCLDYKKKGLFTIVDFNVTTIMLLSAKKAKKITDSRV